MTVLNVILLSVLASFVSCVEYVPVLMWSTQTTEDSYPIIPALTKLTSNEFSDYLLKRVKHENPLILVFREENLSVEDFSWKDLNGNGAFPMLSNLTRLADDVAFIPSVNDPYRAVKKLKNYGYSWRFYEKQGFDSLKDGKKTIFEVKLDEPDYLEDRPDMLKRHDEKMAKIYNEALGYRQNVMVIYTGGHTSWMGAELARSKRDTEDTNGSDTMIITDRDNMIRMTVKPPIVFTKESKEVKINKVIGDPTIQETAGDLILRARFQFNDKEILVNFKFDAQMENWWTLKSVDITGEVNENNLTPSQSVGAPSGYSYFCNPSVVFSNNTVSLTFTNFQVQPRIGSTTFGPVIHCINYFSIGILSGLVVVFILSVVLAWGITMIMDINTNDRFDDPKGKTITITATD